MKLYKVVLVDRREEFVVADSYMESGDQYHFYIGGDQYRTFSLRPHPFLE